MSYFPNYKNEQLQGDKYFYNKILTIFSDYIKDIIIGSHKKHNVDVKKEDSIVINIAS